MSRNYNALTRKTTLLLCVCLLITLPIFDGYAKSRSKQNISGVDKSSIPLNSEVSYALKKDSGSEMGKVPNINMTVTDSECDSESENLCNGFAEIIVKNSNDYSVKWSTGETTSSITGLCPGEYSATIIGSNYAYTETFIIEDNCHEIVFEDDFYNDDEIEENVENSDYLNLDIPQFFSPNRDGLNDVWEIPGLLDLPYGADLLIVSSTGEETYKFSNYGQDGEWWDGTYQNNPNSKVASGTYFYILVFDGDSRKSRKGYVLIRG